MEFVNFDVLLVTYYSKEKLFDIIFCISVADSKAFINTQTNGILSVDWISSKCCLKQISIEFTAMQTHLATLQSSHTTIKCTHMCCRMI